MKVLAAFGANPFHSLAPIALTLAMLTGSAKCQSGPVQISRQDAKLRKQYENRVSKLFETIRQEAGLPHLSRIRDRRDLVQLVCSAAVNDASPSANAPAAVMYRTRAPETTTEELDQIARFKDLEPDPTPPWTRYAVAVWPATDSESKQRVWWVGIKIYTSALMEWVDNNLTDDRPYRNNWKKLVAPGCRDVR